MSEAFAAVLSFLFGSPKAIFASRIFAALIALCPCRAPTDLDACQAARRGAAAVIATVAWEGQDPEADAATLLGIGAHETGFRTLKQRGGPAVSWWQLEVSPPERAALLASPIVAARRALGIARGCGGSLRAYATGRCDGGGEEGAQKAFELRGLVHRARALLARK